MKQISFLGSKWNKEAELQMRFIDNSLKNSAFQLLKQERMTLIAKILKRLIYGVKIKIVFVASFYGGWSRREMSYLGSFLFPLPDRRLNCGEAWDRAHLAFKSFSTVKLPNKKLFRNILYDNNSETYLIVVIL